MKKLNILIINLLLAASAWAQTPTNRTAATVVADVLAQMPVQNQKAYNQLIGDLAKTGEEGVLNLVSKLNAPGKGSNAAAEYAISALTHYVSVSSDEALRSTISSAYVKALKAASVSEVKQFVITQLQVVGKDEAVDGLAPLLGFFDVSDYAARALASINTEKAGNALKTALLRKMGTAETQRNIVLAIGEARVGGTEELLTTLLGTDNEELKRDVLYALSRVGSAASIKTLADAAAKAGYGYDKTNAVDAYIELLTNLSDSKLAEDLLLKATKAKQNGTRIAALQLIIDCQKDKSFKTLQIALKDPSAEYRNAALDAFSVYADKKSYVELLKTAAKSKSADLKTDIYSWLGREAACPDKKAILAGLETGVETTAVGDLIKQLNSKDLNVMSAVAKTLVALGNEQAIPALAGLLTSQDPHVVTLAKNTLSTFKGNISGSVVKTIASSSDNGKIAAIELLASRKSSEHVSSILDLTKSGSPDVKKAAYTALKDVVELKDITNLFGMLETDDKTVVAPLQQAVIAAIAGLTPIQQAEMLAKRSLQAGESKKHLYYTPLAATGQPVALATIVEGFNQSTGDAKEAAFNALINCNTLDAAPYLYQICKSSASSAYLDKALTTYIKITSNPSLTGENRLIYLRKAMETAQTDAQKNTILKQIAQTGTYFGLLFAGEYLDKPALKENAAQAVMNIALNHKEFTGDNVKTLLQKAGAALNNPDADYQRQSIKKHLDEMPDTPSFISLFNGKDLTGWKGLLASPNDNPLKRAQLKPAELAKAQKVADEQAGKDWIVENGMLAFVGHGYNNLCTEKKYADFEMYVDWMLDPAGPEADAGIYLRGTPQVQIWDTARRNVGAQVGSGGLYNNKVHKSKPLVVADNKLGEWNTMYIKMIGDRVTVILNGVLVTDNVVLENYWDKNQPVLPVEQIELQAHGSKVYYRNIYVREIERPKPYELTAQEKKEGFKILFDGTNMYEWTGDMVNYQLKDGCISVEPKQSFGGNLYTKDEYANFAFRFEFQLTPGANNGVGIRTPLEGDAAYAGMEIQILDCENEIYKDIKPYQHHGSVYGVIAAEHGAMKPVGEWNEEEIYADGDHIRVTLNGKVILDGNIREATKNGTVDRQNHPGLFNKSGHIGFLGHGSPLKFRNIRVKKLK
ncbi:MAG: DUF1080 domain-containing protein [Tannerella sp.]|jgi:HEAT repeat protein|nr:DUF1080 domain-containing protein [Tannerella sp.]